MTDKKITVGRIVELFAFVLLALSCAIVVFGLLSLLGGTKWRQIQDGLMLAGMLMVAGLAIFSVGRMIKSRGSVDPKAALFAITGKVVSTSHGEYGKHGKLLHSVKLEQDSDFKIIENVIIPNHLADRIEVGSQGTFFFVKGAGCFTTKQGNSLYGYKSDKAKEVYASPCAIVSNEFLRPRGERWQSVRSGPSFALLMLVGLACPFIYLPFLAAFWVTTQPSDELMEEFVESYAAPA